VVGQGSTAVRVTLGCGFRVADSALRRAAFTAAAKTVQKGSIELAAQLGILRPESC
jgi:hypothetical protein